MNLEAKLEEYRQTRADIRQLYNRRDQTLYLAFFLFTGVISVGIKFENSILFFMTCIILLFLWYQETVRQIAIYRYEAYIIVKIEDYIQELKRSTLSWKHPSYINPWKRLKRGISYITLIILIGTCFRLGIYYFFNSCNPIISYFLYLTFIIIISVFFIVLTIYTFYVFTIRCRDKEKENWEKIKD